VKSGLNCIIEKRKKQKIYEKLETNIKNVKEAMEMVDRSVQFYWTSLAL